MESDQIEIMNGDELSNQLDAVCDLLSSQKFLLVTLDPKTMTTTCVGSQLGLQFLHHKPSDDKDVHNVSAILKQFLSDYYKTREITLLERLLPDNSHDSSADKNCEAKDQRNSRNTKNCKELSKNEVNDYTVLEWGSQRTVYNKTREIAQLLVKLLPDNSVYGSSADKNQRNSKNTKNWKELSKKEVNDNTVHERGSKRKDMEQWLQNQMLIHREAKFPCNICGKKFRMMQYVRTHINRVHKNILSIAKTEDAMANVFSIAKTEDAMANVVSIAKTEDAMANDDIDENVRMKESKQIKPRIQTPGICDVCGKSFCNLTSMLNHRTIHFEDRPYPCTKCNKKFRLQNSLRQHMMIHQDTKDYICERCGKSFKVSEGLRIHRLRYHDKVHYKCEICDRKFMSLGGKKYHESSHTGSHVCDLCDSRWATASQLIVHRKSHFGLNKKFHCKICQYKTSTLSKLKRHLTTAKHTDNCQSAGHKSISVAAMMENTDIVEKLNSEDEKIDTENDNLCDSRWATASQLNVHRKSHFGLNKKFHCKICQYKTTSPWKLKRHLTTAKHRDNCQSAGHKSISVAAMMENTDIVEKFNSEDGKIDTEDDKTKKETSQVQGQTEVVSMETGEIISSPSQGQSSTEQLQVVEVKCCDMAENLVEGSQIFYTEQGGILYSIVEKGVELDSKTYIYDPSDNQAVESILKHQNS